MTVTVDHSRIQVQVTLGINVEAHDISQQVTSVEENNRAIDLLRNIKK